MRLSLLLTLGLTALDAQTLDRIAVTSGKTVITESEILLSIRVAAFLDQKDPDFSVTSKRKAAERLVDQLLLRREVPSATGPQEAPGLITEIKKRYVSEADFHAALEHYGVTEKDVNQQLFNGLESIDASNRRFRAEIQVTPEEIRGYYDKLAAQWRAKDPNNVPGFEASRDQVQELLTNERVSEALEKWLELARQEGSIVYHEKVFK